MSREPASSIPKSLVKPDADITALINEEGYVLNTVHAQSFVAIVPPSDAIGRHLSDLYRPVPEEILQCLEQTFDGSAHWAALTLPTVSAMGIVERRFVVAFEPYEAINNKQVALVRMKLLTDNTTDALEHVGKTQNALRTRANYLISDEFSLNSVYMDALVDVSMRQSGFDAAILLDEDGVVLDVFNVSSNPPTVQKGGNFVDFLSLYDPGFQDRWDFALNHWQYINSIEQFPLPDGSAIAVLIRLRVTDLIGPNGKRIVQVFARQLE